MALERGKVFVNDLEVTPADAGRSVEAGDRVRVWMDRPGSARAARAEDRGRRRAQILYEDTALIVVNKPAGLLTVPLPPRDADIGSRAARRASANARQAPADRRPSHRPRHVRPRRVREATRAQHRLKDQFRRREPERVYLAVVYGIRHRPRAPGATGSSWDHAALIQKETHPW